MRTPSPIITKLLKRSAALILLIVIFSAPPAFAAGRPEDQPAPGDQIATLPPVPFQRLLVQDRLGRSVTYFVSKAATPLPLLLIIQGSGCAPGFVSRGGVVGGTIVGGNDKATLARFTVLLVEKPFPKVVLTQDGAISCSAEFNESFSADTWLVALLAALRQAEKLPWVDHDHVYVLGESEGAAMAADVAGHAPEIDGVIFQSGSGSGQAFDVLADAFNSASTPTDAETRIRGAEDQIRVIMADPNDAKRFAWGHTFLRWSSFFRLSALSELRQSSAKVYVMSGTADRNSPFLSNEILVAGLLADGRDVFNRVVPNGDHALQDVEHPSWAQTAAEFQKAFDWIQRETASASVGRGP